VPTGRTMMSRTVRLDLLKNSSGLTVMEHQYLEEVKAVEVGTRIAIKATRTTKHDLLFDAKGNTVSFILIDALYTVTANRGDGRHLELEWVTDYEPRDWYFYTISGGPRLLDTFSRF